MADGKAVHNPHPIEGTIKSAATTVDINRAGVEVAATLEALEMAEISDIKESGGAHPHLVRHVATCLMVEKIALFGARLLRMHLLSRRGKKSFVKARNFQSLNEHLLWSLK